jgi:hypothetical protein
MRKYQTTYQLGSNLVACDLLYGYEQLRANKINK